MTMGPGKRNIFCIVFDILNIAFFFLFLFFWIWYISFQAQSISQFPFQSIYEFDTVQIEAGSTLIELLILKVLFSMGIFYLLYLFFYSLFTYTKLIILKRKKFNVKQMLSFYKVATYWFFPQILLLFIFYKLMGGIAGFVSLGLFILLLPFYINIKSNFFEHRKFLPLLKQSKEIFTQKFALFYFKYLIILTIYFVAVNFIPYVEYISIILFILIILYAREEYP